VVNFLTPAQLTIATCARLLFDLPNERLVVATVRRCDFDRIFVSSFGTFDEFDDLRRVRDLLERKAAV